MKRSMALFALFFGCGNTTVVYVLADREDMSHVSAPADMATPIDSAKPEDMADLLLPPDMLLCGTSGRPCCDGTYCKGPDTFCAYPNTAFSKCEACGTFTGQHCCSGACKKPLTCHYNYGDPVGICG